ncbi:MAG: hypothetical protein GXO73_00335 [Calditrichaeota bacterium]|nr:hypothetical protein [Calditrichota bacterium]
MSRTSFPPNSQNTTQAVHPPSVAVVLKKTFWNVYDHLGKLLILNFLSFLLALTVVGLPFAVAGLYSLANRIADYRAVGLRDYFRLGAQGYFLAFKLTAIFVFGALVLGSNVVFHLEDRLGLPAVSMGMLLLTVWFSLLFLVWNFYLFPLAFRFGELSKQVSKSALGLALDNKSFTTWVLLADLVNWLAGAATFVLLVFFAPAVSAVLQAVATRELLSKYHPGLVREGEEQRTLRDLFRPWAL